MCACPGVLHTVITSVSLLLVSAVLTRASSFLRGHGVKVSELWPHFRNTCNLTCPYGYQTDVEGNFVCHCHDPCKNVLCFGRTRCVVDIPKTCRPAYCTARATCRDISDSRHQVPFPQPGVLLADDAATTSARTSYPERCLLPVRGKAEQCPKNTRLRWFFDSASGSCKQFLGCRKKGNNFKRRRGCEKSCLGLKARASWQPQPHYKSQLYPQHDGANIMTPAENKVKVKVRLTIPAACHVAPVPVTSGCKKVRRRWFFDITSGKCRKFRSCPTPGNNFRKRKHCKNRCLRLGKTSRRKGRRGQSRSAKQ